MKLPTLKIRGLEAEFPVIQAGMGCRIGMAKLASAVVNCGGFGTIASVGIGDLERGKTHFVDECNTNLALELKNARELCGGRKNLGVNVMVALSNYEDLVRTAVAAGADYIISGAGLPLPLPEYVGDADVALIPVISSGRAFEVVVKTWLRKYQRKPDAVIIEGPRCGGHLGFTMEMIEHPETCSLDMLLKDVKEVIARYGLDGLPVLAAGEVCCREDIEKFLKMGYDGVQIGTYFLTTEEAAIDARSKQVFIDAKSEDIVVIKSPVGLPVRVLRTPLVQRVLSGSREPFKCPYRCLRSCNPAKSLFCIAQALIATWRGDTDNGLYMVGCNIESCRKIFPVKEFFDTLAGA